MDWVANLPAGDYLVEHSYSSWWWDRVERDTPGDCKPTGEEDCYPAAVTFRGWMVPDLPKTVRISSLPPIDPNLKLIAKTHIVGSAEAHPPTYNEAISGMTVKVFDMADSCVNSFGGKTWQNYGAMYNGCVPVRLGVTDSEGVLGFALPYEADFMAIGELVASDPVYIGTSVGEVLLEGSLKVKHIKLLVNLNKPEKKVPAKSRKLTGSELLIIEPEYVEWSDQSELYPIVFESIGDWSVTTSVEPPEGFVADQDSLATEVNTDLKAVQFTLTDVGTEWKATKLKHKVKHKGKVKTIESEIGIMLTPELAKKKGVCIYGEDSPEKCKDEDKKKKKQ
jgi:hypothetical protein